MRKASRTNRSVGLRHGGTCSKKCVERYCELANKKVEQLYNVSGWPSIQAGGTRISWRIVRSLLTNEMLVLGANWTSWQSVVGQQACKISHKMDSGMWQTTGKADFLYSLHEWHRQFCHVENTAQHCRLGLFQDSDFACDLEDSKSTQLDLQEANCCLAQFYRVWNHFSGRWIAYGRVTCSWSLGHSDWSATFNQQQCPTQTYEHAQAKTQKVKRRQKVDQWSDVEDVPTNTFSSHNESQLCIFEDNEAVIKMIMKWRSLTMRHVSRTHRVAHDLFFDRIKVEPKIQIKYVNTKNEFADLLTKDSFTRDEWNHLLCMFTNVNFSMYSWSHFSNFLFDISDHVRKQSAMSKRGQKTTSNEGSPMVKAKPSLVLREQRSEEISSRSLGSLVNPENVDERKEVMQASRELVQRDSNSKVGYSQASRQEKVPQASRKLVLKNQNQTEKDEREHSNSKSSRKLAASSPELKNMEYKNHQYTTKIFSVSAKEIGSVCNQRNILNGSIQNKCVEMVNVDDFVDESRHLSWAE